MCTVRKAMTKIARSIVGLALSLWKKVIRHNMEVYGFKLEHTHKNPTGSTGGCAQNTSTTIRYHVNNESHVSWWHHCWNVGGFPWERSFGVRLGFWNVLHAFKRGGPSELFPAYHTDHLRMAAAYGVWWGHVVFGVKFFSNNNIKRGTELTLKE